MMTALLRTAARQALQWRLLLLWLAALSLPAILAALPLHALLADTFDHHVRAAELTRQLDLVAITDLRALLSQRGSITAMAAVAVALSALLAPFLAGASIACARHAGEADWDVLLKGGASDYLRMLRMALAACLPLALALAIVSAASGAYDATLEQAVQESDAVLTDLVGSTISVLALALALTWGDSARALLALDRRKRSALGAMLAALRIAPRRQARLFGAYVLVSALGLGLATLLMRARFALPYWDGAGDWLLLIMTEVAVLLVAWTRCTRLFALMAIHVK